MDKGQHIRLVIQKSSSNNSFIALATELTFHLSASTENSTTKDTTDANKMWDEYDVTGRSGDIQFSALIGIGEKGSDDIDLDEMIDHFGTDDIYWRVVAVSLDRNRTISKEICHGHGILTSLNPQGQNRQNATYSGAINIQGAVVVGND